MHTRSSEEDAVVIEEAVRADDAVSVKEKTATWIVCLISSPCPHPPKLLEPSCQPLQPPQSKNLHQLLAHC